MYIASLVHEYEAVHVNRMVYSMFLMQYNMFQSSPHVDPLSSERSEVLTGDLTSYTASSIDEKSIVIFFRLGIYCL